MWALIGKLVTLFTFPGIIIHEVAHQFFCRFFRVAILEVCYFRLASPEGYIMHEPPRKPYQCLLIGMGPFFINSLLGILIAFPAVIPVWTFKSESAGDFFLIWLGLSIAMHAFPTTGDAKVIWKAVWSEGTSLALRLIAIPLVGIIYLGAIGSVVWLDFIYAAAILMYLPNLIISLLA